MNAADSRPAAWRVWLTAVRPFAFPASAMPVLLGTCLSWYDRQFLRWGSFVLALFGVVLVHAAANLLNDVYDYRRGLDRRVTPTSGAVVRGWLSERQALSGGIVCLFAGAVAGLVLVASAGWALLVFGLVGVALALAYTTPGPCLKYSGLGDLSIFAAFGPLPVLGAYWVQAGRLSALALFWSLPLALLTVGILHANNWRDLGSDRRHGCTTVASLLGERRAAIYYRFLLFSPFAMVPLCVIADALLAGRPWAPWFTLLTLAGLPKALAVSRHATGDPDSGAFAMLDGLTAQTQLLFGALLCSAFVLARALG